jgi:hypothetical protein
MGADFAFCPKCGQPKAESTHVSTNEQEHQVFDWIFTRHNTDKYNNIEEDLRSHLDNHKIKGIRKYISLGLEIHFPEVLNEKLYGDADENGSFVFWEHKLAVNFKGLHQARESARWGNLDFAFLTQNYLVLINDSISRFSARDKDFCHVIRWDQIDMIVAALDSYVLGGFATVVEWHWRMQFQLTNGKVYERLFYIGMDEKGHNENIDSSLNLFRQMGHLCAQAGKKDVIHFVEGSSTFNDLTPKFSYGVFKEIGD